MLLRTSLYALVAVGTALVAAACGGGYSGTTAPAAAAAVFTAVSVTPAAIQLAPGAKQSLVARAMDQNGSAMTGTGFAAPAFTSSSTAVATVDATGMVTAIANGSATISASVTGNGVTKSGSASILVATSGGFPSIAAVQANETTGPYNTDATFSWAPSTIDIAVGGTVVFTNQTSSVHNVTYSAAMGAPADIATWGGDNRSSTFNTAGTFNYACSIHPNMTGVIVVH